MTSDFRTNPDVSVVMATYNGARHLEEQLASILRQTLLPAEIVITDDRSTDETAAVAREVAGRSVVPIRFSVNPERLGYADNFLHAAALSTGRYIAFSDQDDIWHPEKLARSRKVLDQPGVHLVGHQMNHVDETGRFLRLDRHGTDRTVTFAPGRADPFGVLFGFTMTFDRRLLALLPAEHRGADSYRPSMPLAHDRWVYLLATTFGSVVLLAEPLADYRQHDSQSFGVRDVAFRTRLAVRAAAGARGAVALSRIADARARQMERADPPQVPNALVTADDWSKGADRWRTIQTYSRRRARTYARRSAAARLTALLTNVVTGGYRSHRSGGLGGHHLLEDLALGVALPLVRRSGA